MVGLASAIIGGLSAMGLSIHRGLAKNRQRKAEIEKLNAQKTNLKAIMDYKNQMYDLQKTSLENQFKQGQKALNMARSVTEANQQTALRQGAEADWMQTQQLNRQAKALGQQGQEQIGSASQRASLSGFRGSGSVNNLESKQTQLANDAKNELQAQMAFSRYQNMANSANAYTQSNVQLAQYAMEKEAQKQNKEDTEAQMQLQNDFENQQYDAQVKQIDDTTAYLGDYNNFWLNDFMDLAGTTINAGLQIGGVVEQDKAFKENRAYQEEQAQINRDFQTEMLDKQLEAQANENKLNREYTSSQSVLDRLHSQQMAQNAQNNQLDILSMSNGLQLDKIRENYFFMNDSEYRKNKLNQLGLMSVR